MKNIPDKKSAKALGMYVILVCGVIVVLGIVVLGLLMAKGVIPTTMKEFEKKMSETSRSKHEKVAEDLSRQLGVKVSSKNAWNITTLNQAIPRPVGSSSVIDYSTTAGAFIRVNSDPKEFSSVRERSQVEKSQYNGFEIDIMERGDRPIPGSVRNAVYSWIFEGPETNVYSAKRPDTDDWYIIKINTIGKDPEKFEKMKINLFNWFKPTGNSPF